MWEHGKNDPRVEDPGMQVISDGDSDGPKPESCIMTGGRAKLCTDDPKTSKRAKLFSLKDNGPIDLVFDVIRDDGSCSKDPIYRLFLKYLNLSKSRIESFRVQLGTGTGAEFEFDSSLKFTSRDGESPFQTQNDLAVLFAFGLFGKSVGEPQHPYDGYYDPNERANFVVALSSNGVNDEIVASKPTDNFQDLYGGTMKSWIPKSLAPKGYFFDDDGDPDTDAPLAGDWDGSQWVTRLLCGALSDSLDDVHTQMLNAGLIEESECITSRDVLTPVPLSSTTLSKWFHSELMTEGIVEDFGNVNLNAHVRYVMTSLV